MDNKNKPQEPTTGQPDNIQQSTASPANESTYWEETQMPEPTGMHSPTIKRRSHGKLIVRIIILLLLLSGAATAYAFQDTLRNTFALATKSPAQYYAYVEKNAIRESVDEFLPYMNFAPKEIAYDTAVDITFNREALDSIMQSTLGTSMADLETTLGFPIENIGFDSLVGYKDGLLNEILGVRLNQVNLITMELFMDLVKQEVLIRLPDLSQAYLKQSLNTGDTSSPANQMNQLNLMTADRTADLIQRYGNILVDHIDQVELEKNNVLTLDTLSESYTKLTITLTEKDMNTIAMAFLEEAREDEYIIDMLPMFNTTMEEYQQAIDDAKIELQDPSNVMMEGQTLQMLVYVDNSGYIIGRELSMTGSPSVVGYTSLIKKNYNEFNLYLKDDTGNTILNGTGNQTNNQGVYDGTITVEYNNPSTEPFSNLSFDIKYEDVRTEKKENAIYQYGKYTFSSLDLMGLQILMENSVAEDTQNNKIIFQMGASPLVTIDTKINYYDNYAFAKPSETAEIYDTTQAESYMATMDIEGYLSKLSEQLGVDLNSLLGLFQNDFPIE